MKLRHSAVFAYKSLVGLSEVGLSESRECDGRVINLLRRTILSFLAFVLFLRSLAALKSLSLPAWLPCSVFALNLNGDVYYIG